MRVVLDKNEKPLKDIELDKRVNSITVILILYKIYFVETKNIII